MLPVGPGFVQSQSYGYAAAPFIGSAYIPHDATSASVAAASSVDPNDPDLFKPNLRLVHQQVLQLQDLARRTLHEIQNAYQNGRDPATTQNDLQTLNQVLQHLVASLQQTGVGALPLLPDPTSMTPPLPTEAQLLERTQKSLQEVYEKLKRNKESAQAVADLLAIDHTPRTGVVGAATGAGPMAPQISQQPSSMSQVSHR